MADSFRLNTIVMNSVWLSNYNSSSEVQIADMVTEINIFESIYSNIIVGNITIVDSNDLIQFFPIIGKESIIIDMVLPGEDANNNWVIENFQIYKISDRKIESDKVQHYTLWFASPEYIVNSKTRVTKSWNNKTIDQIVQDIFDKNLKYTNDKKLNIPTKTLGNQTYIAPAWRPLEVINWLCENRTINQNNLADYMFFETFTEDYKDTQYNFVSLSELTKKNPVAKFTYEPMNLYSGKNKLKLHNVEDISFQRDIDTLRLNLKGLYNQVLIYYDPVRKKTVTEKISYKDIFEKTSDYKFGKLTPILDSDFTPDVTSVLMVNEFPINISSNKGINNIITKSVEKTPKRIDEEYIKKNGSSENSYMVEKIKKIRDVLMAEFEMFKVNLNGVSGNYRIYGVGKVVEFEKPHIVNNRDEVFKETGAINDTLLSGNYLITKLRHRIVRLESKFEYKNYIEISKNSFI
jgi:hypothetical protein